jgi:hypothetical protein
VHRYLPQILRTQYRSTVTTLSTLMRLRLRMGAHGDIFFFFSDLMSCAPVAVARAAEGTGARASSSCVRVAVRLEAPRRKFEKSLPWD